MDITIQNNRSFQSFFFADCTYFSYFDCSNKCFLRTIYSLKLHFFWSRSDYSLPITKRARTIAGKKVTPKLGYFFNFFYIHASRPDPSAVSIRTKLSTIPLPPRFQTGRYWWIKMQSKQRQRNKQQGFHFLSLNLIFLKFLFALKTSPPFIKNPFFFAARFRIRFNI